MIDLATWNIATDVLLFGALGFVALRMLRTPEQGASTQALQIARELRALVDEANSIERALGDELNRRRRIVEELLQDANQSEVRLRSAVGAARNTVVAAAPAGHPSTGSSATVSEPPSFERATSTLGASQNKSARPTSGRVNIYGEAIDDTTPSPPTAQSPVRRSRLNEAVEKESTASSRATGMHSYAAMQRASDTMQPIYSAAEDLLRAGKDLEFVAHATRMSVDEVRMISRMMMQEEAASESATPDRHREEDPRLGVLGTAGRRTAQTI